MESIIKGPFECQIEILCDENSSCSNMEFGKTTFFSISGSFQEVIYSLYPSWSYVSYIEEGFIIGVGLCNSQDGSEHFREIDGGIQFLSLQAVRSVFAQYPEIPSLNEGQMSGNIVDIWKDWTSFLFDDSKKGSVLMGLLKLQMHNLTANEKDHSPKQGDNVTNEVLVKIHEDEYQVEEYGGWLRMFSFLVDEYFDETSSLFPPSTLLNPLSSSTPIYDLMDLSLPQFPVGDPDEGTVRDVLDVMRYSVRTVHPLYISKLYSGELSFILLFLKNITNPPYRHLPPWCTI